MIEYNDFKNRVDALKAGTLNKNSKDVHLLDEEFLMSVVQHRVNFIEKFPANVFTEKTTKKIFLFNNYLIEKFPEEIKANKELMLPLLKINPLAYNSVSKEIQEDVDIFIEVLKETDEVLDSIWDGKNKIMHYKNALKIVKTLPNYTGYFSKFLKQKDWNELAPILIKNKVLNAFNQMEFNKVDIVFIRKIISLSPSVYLRLKDNQQQDLVVISKTLKAAMVEKNSFPNVVQKKLYISAVESLEKGFEKNLYSVEKFISTYKKPLTKEIWDTFVFSTKFVKRTSKQNIDLSLVKENFEETLRELNLRESLAKEFKNNKFEERGNINKKAKI